MKKSVAVINAVVLSAMLGIGLTGCGSEKKADDANTSSATAANNSDKSDKADDKKADNKSDDSAGHQEFPVAPEKEVGPLNVHMVYFQPVDMYPAGMSLPASQSSFHLEADIKALADNELGYGKDDFVPDLTVDYKITEKDGGKVAAEGTFMQMNADDGPHYGANVKLDKAGKYVVSLTIKSPEEKGWMLHIDAETGVKGRFWNEPLKVDFDWDYTPHQW